MNIVRVSSKVGVATGLGTGPCLARHVLMTGLLGAAGCLTGMTGPAAAQSVPYKVTGPDGRVTYTDRPSQEARSVQPLGTAAKAAPAESTWLDGLPFALKQVAQRFPVTLYTAAGCAACDQGRQLLQQRGVPFKEFKVEPGAGNELRRREGTNNLPVLRVGQQQLVGWEAGEWRQTLIAAGYPPSGALPANWPPPAVQSLSPAPASKADASPEQRATPVPRETPETEASPLPAKRFRF